MKPEIALVVGMYIDRREARMGELVEALARNLSNPAISAVHFLIEEPAERYEEYVSSNACAASRSLRGLAQHPKIEVVPLGRRAKYEDYFAHVNSRLSGRIVIVTNADIYFDDTVRLIAGLDMANMFVCLSRTEADGISNPNMWGSQDSWIFLSPIRPFPSNWHLGVPGCDNKIAHEAFSAGMKVINPCLSVRANHLHASGERNYTSSDCVPGPYRVIQPCTLDGMRSEGKS